MNAYLVVNNYQPRYTDGDNTEILGLSLSEDRAEDILTAITAPLSGSWTESHTVFQSDNTDMEYDSYYIETYEVSE